MKVVGDGPLRDRLQEQIGRLEATNHIEISGEVAQSDVIPLMRQARIFVLNSSYEGLPHVVLEAMSAGTPVIATDVGGTGEVVKDMATGLLIPYGDEHSLDTAIDKLLRDSSLRNSIATGALELVSKEFSFENMRSNTAIILSATNKKKIISP